MKKIAFAALALMGVVCSSAAEDSFLYWMVGNSATLGEEKKAIEGSYNAKVVAIQGTEWVYNAGGAYLDLYYDMADQQSFGKMTPDLGSRNDLGVVNNLAYFANIGTTGEGWTYFIELYHDNTIFARSEGLPYSEGAIATLMEGIQAPTGKLWAVPAFVPAAVPEPNSALLMLIGCAALALRRRKQIAA